MLIGNELVQSAFGQHRMAEVKAPELILSRTSGDRQVFKKPVIQRSVVLELQSAHRMGYPFDGVRLTMCEVVVGVDAPRIPRARMRVADDPVQNRVAQIDVAGTHIDPGAKDLCAIW